MATPLDTSLIAYLTPVFVLILVYAIIYALISKLSLFGKSPVVHAAIAFSTSFLFLIIPAARTVLTVFTPWFIILVILTLFIFLFFMFLGVKEDQLASLATKNTTFITFTDAAILIIFLIALSQTFGPFLLTTNQPGFWNAVKRTIFHPKTLGAIFLLMLAAYTINYLSNPVSTK